MYRWYVTAFWTILKKVGMYCNIQKLFTKNCKQLKIIFSFNTKMEIMKFN